MGEIEKVEENRTALVERAWALYQKGYTHKDIGDDIGKHRNTVAKYIKEYAGTIEDDDIEFQRVVSVAQLRKVIQHAWTKLEDGDIKDSSLTRPQLLHQITQAVKEINKVSGLHVTYARVQHEGVQSLFDAVGTVFTDDDSLGRRRFQEMDEKIEEADVIEVIEDNEYDTLS